MKNPIEFREWFKILFRVWRQNMSPNEFLVAQFIFDRTAGWGKEWEVIKTSHFLSGVVGKDGKIYASGLILTPPTLRKCLASLIGCGAIRMIQEKRKKAYALNYEWNPYEIENYATMPPIPKRLQKLQQAERENNFPKTSEMENDFPSEGKISFRLEKKRKDKCYAKEEISSEHAARDSHATHGEALLKAAHHLDKETRKSVARRQSNIKEWKSPDTAYKAWIDLCDAFHPDSNHLAVTKTDCVVLHRYGLRFAKAFKTRSLLDWLDYFSWVVERWHTLREFHFDWMKTNSPAVPSIRFFVRFSESFEQAWAAKQNIEHFATLSTRDREVELRVLKGIDRLVAEKEVDTRLGLIKAKQEMESAAAKLKRQQAAFENAKADHTASAERNARWRNMRQPQSIEGTFDQWE